jgi:hypothetical protein
MSTLPRCSAPITAAMSSVAYAVANRSGAPTDSSPRARWARSIWFAHSATMPGTSGVEVTPANAWSGSQSIRPDVPVPRLSTSSRLRVRSSGP